MKKLTYSELIERLKNTAGMVIVGLRTCTDARLLKTGNPLALPVYKHARVVGHVGANYGNAVNREAQRQNGVPVFVPGALPKGRKPYVENKVLVSDDGSKFYLRTESTPGKRRKQPNRILGFTDANGNEVAREIVAQFTPVKHENRKQQRTTEIEATVHVNDYLFSSIRQIKLQGETFELVAD